MTGCPNGCARPYVAEIGLVGDAVDRYQVWLGGDAAGTRLATGRRGRQQRRPAELLRPCSSATATSGRPARPSATSRTGPGSRGADAVRPCAPRRRDPGDTGAAPHVTGVGRRARSPRRGASSPASRAHLRRTPRRWDARPRWPPRSRCIGRDRLPLVTSLAPEGIVILDLLTKVIDRPRVVTLDTGRLPPRRTTSSTASATGSASTSR